MCILCVIQKWSRRVATMLPWLVLPLIGLWALSQLLPPAFRFEITSPRLACVFVLLVTLFWYEILMPQLSAWRTKRNARLRERKRFEAIEMQKLRKTATRRCRNCLNPYRDQNPGGGRFMCSYCGHISKRPVLDLPALPGLGLSNLGIVKDLVGKSSKILNGKAWSESGWICSQEWSESGHLVGGSIPGNSGFWTKSGSGLFVGDDQCFTEKSYSGIVFFACKLLSSFFLSIRWLWRKIFRISSSKEECSSDGDHRSILAKRTENGDSHESRGERSRRKAEEKRQARLEKKLLEEEERKQRAEVARLVEERRKLRDEKMEAEKDHPKLSPPVREKESKKDMEKRRQEKRKDKDNGSSKSNSDTEEVEKKAGKEYERKRGIDKKSETDSREPYKPGFNNGKNTENVYGARNMSGNNYSRGNTGSRYFDHMRGTFLSTSKAFGFGRGTNTPATSTKENNFNCSVDPVQSQDDRKHERNSMHRREILPSERVNAKPNMNADDRNNNHTVFSESQPAPKKSWQQLFTRSSSFPHTSDANVKGRSNSKFHSDVPDPPVPGQSYSSTQTLDNATNFGLPSQFNMSTYPNVSTSSSLGFSSPIEHINPHFGEKVEFIQEELELFEDPCYVPDPFSLLGPVSESLDNFQLDLGTDCMEAREMEKTHALKNMSAGYEVNKPSPIESPMSREKHGCPNRFPSIPQIPDTHAVQVDDSTVNDKGTWQMWNSTPLCQDGLNLVCGSTSLLSANEWNRPNKHDFVHLSSQKTMGSLFTNEDHILSGPRSPHSIFLGNDHNAGAFNPAPGSKEHFQWLPNVFSPSSSGSENTISLKSQEDAAQTNIVYMGPSRPANKPYEISSANCWSKTESPVHGSCEGVGKASVTSPHAESLYPTPDIESLWKFS